MGKVGGEVEVGLKPPSVEGLKFVEESSRYPSRDVCKPGRLDRKGREQNSENIEGSRSASEPSVNRTWRTSRESSSLVASDTASPSCAWFTKPVGTYIQSLSRVQPKTSAGS